VTRDDADIITTEKFLNMDKTKSFNLTDNNFNVMMYMAGFDAASGEFQPVDIPSDIGYFRMLGLNQV